MAKIGCKDKYNALESISSSFISLVTKLKNVISSCGNVMPLFRNTSTTWKQFVISEQCDTISTLLGIERTYLFVYILRSV